MRYAVLALTADGAKQAIKTAEALDKADVFLSAKNILPGKNIQTFDKLKECVKTIFSQYDCLIFIMAAGIVVRTLAPHLVSKLADPAVLVMDEKGRHIISLLSGHVGGANFVAETLAEKLGAEAVITTATDNAGLLAPDKLAGYLYLIPYPKKQIMVVNSAILQGKKLNYYLEQGIRQENFYRHELAKFGILPQLITKEAIADITDEAVVITNSDIIPAKGLLLKPGTIIAGVGCRRGTEAELIRKALTQATEKIGLDISFIDQLASTEVKADEAGLLKTAENLAVPVKFWSTADLQAKINEYGLKTSAFVAKTIGAGNVCEAAALCSAGRGRIALPKTKFEKVTVALIWQK